MTPGPSPSLREALHDYLALRRSVGFKLAAAGHLLGQFIDYLDSLGIDTITTDVAVAWAHAPSEASPHWLALRLRAVRGFAAYLHGLDPTLPVPPAGLLRTGPCRATPYLYSPAQIAALLDAAAGLCPPLRAATYRSLIGLLSVTGLRVGEAIALDEADFDSLDGLLSIRNAKFNKSRLVPLHPTTTSALVGYLALRAASCAEPASPALFISTRGTRLHHSNISLTFSQLADQTGVIARSASCRPRLHDFRHTMAVTSLLEGYRRGDDVAVLLPRLATLLGHSDPKHSYWYLSAAPELMAIAADRLEGHQGGPA